jgi:hypothetical protein
MASACPPTLEACTMGPDEDEPEKDSVYPYRAPRDCRHSKFAARVIQVHAVQWTASVQCPVLRPMAEHIGWVGCSIISFAAETRKQAEP